MLYCRKWDGFGQTDPAQTLRERRFNFPAQTKAELVLGLKFDFLALGGQYGGRTGSAPNPSSDGGAFFTADNATQQCPHAGSSSDYLGISALGTFRLNGNISGLDLIGLFPKTKFCQGNGHLGPALDPA